MSVYLTLCLVYHELLCVDRQGSGKHKRDSARAAARLTSSQLALTKNVLARLFNSTSRRSTDEVDRRHVLLRYCVVDAGEEVFWGKSHYVQDVTKTIIHREKCDTLKSAENSGMKLGVSV